MIHSVRASVNKMLCFQWKMFIIEETEKNP